MQRASFASISFVACLALAGCGATAFDGAAGRRDLAAALTEDARLRADFGVSEDRLEVLAELTLLEATRRGGAAERRLSFAELRSLGPRGEPLLEVLAQEGIRPDAKLTPAREGATGPAAEAAIAVDAATLLTAPNPAHRAYVANVLAERGEREALRLVCLGRERDRFVRLTLARGLLATREGPAEGALLTLSRGQDLAGAEAAAALAERGFASATKHLGDLARHGRARSVRIAALRGLARAWPVPGLVPGALADADPAIRIAAAGAVLYALRPRE